MANAEAPLVAVQELLQAVVEASQRIKDVAARDTEAYRVTAGDGAIGKQEAEIEDVNAWLLEALAQIESAVPVKCTVVQQSLQCLREDLNQAELSLSVLQNSTEVGRDAASTALWQQQQQQQRSSCGRTGLLHEAQQEGLRQAAVGDAVGYAPDAIGAVGDRIGEGCGATHPFQSLSSGVKQYLGQFVDWDPLAACDVDGGNATVGVLTRFFGCPYVRRSHTTGTAGGVNSLAAPPPPPPPFAPQPQQTGRVADSRVGSYRDGSGAGRQRPSSDRTEGATFVSDSESPAPPTPPVGPESPSDEGRDRGSAATVAGQEALDRSQSTYSGASLSVQSASSVRAQRVAEFPNPRVSRLCDLPVIDHDLLCHTSVLCRVVDDLVLNQLLHDGIQLTPAMLIELGCPMDTISKADTALSRSFAGAAGDAESAIAVSTTSDGAGSGLAGLSRAGGVAATAQGRASVSRQPPLSTEGHWDSDIAFRVPRELRRGVLTPPQSVADGVPVSVTDARRTSEVGVRASNSLAPWEPSWMELLGLPAEIRVTWRFPETVRWLQSLIGGVDLSEVVGELDHMQRLYASAAPSVDQTISPVVHVTSEVSPQTGGVWSESPTREGMEPTISGTVGPVYARTLSQRTTSTDALYFQSSLLNASSSTFAPDLETSHTTDDPQRSLPSPGVADSRAPALNAMAVDSDREPVHVASLRQEELQSPGHHQVPADNPPRAAIAEVGRGGSRGGGRSDPNSKKHRLREWNGPGLMISRRRWKYCGSSLDFYIWLGVATLLSDLCLLAALQYSAEQVLRRDSVAALVELSKHVSQLSSVSLLLWRRSVEEEDIIPRTADESHPDVQHELRRVARDIAMRRARRLHQHQHSHQTADSTHAEVGKGERAAAEPGGHAWSEKPAPPQLFVSYQMLQEALAHFITNASTSSQAVPSSTSPQPGASPGGSNLGVGQRRGGDGAGPSSAVLSRFLDCATPFLRLYQRGRGGAASAAGSGAGRDRDVGDDGICPSDDVRSDAMPSGIVPRIWVDLLCADLLEQVASLRRLELLRRNTFLAVKGKITAYDSAMPTPSQDMGGPRHVLNALLQCGMNRGTTRTLVADRQAAAAAGADASHSRPPLAPARGHSRLFAGPLPRGDNHLLRVVQPISDVFLSQLALFDESDMLSIIPRRPQERWLHVPVGDEGNATDPSAAAVAASASAEPWRSLTAPALAALNAQGSSDGQPGWAILGSGAFSGVRSEIEGTLRTQNNPWTAGREVHGENRAPSVIWRSRRGTLHGESTDGESREVWRSAGVSYSPTFVTPRQGPPQGSPSRAVNAADSAFSSNELVRFARSVAARARGSGRPGPSAGANDAGEISSPHSALMMELPCATTVLEHSATLRNVLPLSHGASRAAVSSRALFFTADAMRHRYGVVTPQLCDRERRFPQDDEADTPLSSMLTPLAVDKRALQWAQPFRSAACFCPVTKRRCVDLSVCSDEQFSCYNPPKLLKCGHIISHKAVQALCTDSRGSAANARTVRCPYCSTDSLVGEALISVRYV